ncbi:zinc ribbon domain-containing protein [Candidatus Bathyarchaeota archaeon]|nr:zinc ribbon domain-containing protein [Candidatus Bathyarchaeota archaeon]
MLTVGIWITILVIVLVLTYFYRRDQKERKTKVEEKLKPVEEKKDSGKGYILMIKENGSLQVIFKDGEAGERLTSGRAKISASYRGTGKEGEKTNGKKQGTKVFVDRSQMIKFLGGIITCDLPEIIPEEKGTYVLMLDFWKNELTPIEDPELTEAPIDTSYKRCKSCETPNDNDALYCKKCGKQLN